MNNHEDKFDNYLVAEITDKEREYYRFQGELETLRSLLTTYRSMKIPTVGKRGEL